MWNSCNITPITLLILAWNLIYSKWKHASIWKLWLFKRMHIYRAQSCANIVSKRRQEDCTGIHETLKANWHKDAERESLRNIPNYSVLLITQECRAQCQIIKSRTVRNSTPQMRLKILHRMRASSSEVFQSQARYAGPHSRGLGHCVQERRCGRSLQFRCHEMLSSKLAQDHFVLSIRMWIPHFWHGFIWWVGAGRAVRRTWSRISDEGAHLTPDMQTAPFLQSDLG